MIREATLDDVAALVDLGCRFMVESGYSRHLAVNPVAQGAIATMLINAEHGLVLVDEREGEVVGMIGVLATFHPHSNDKVMSELFWYVDPSKRGAGVKLLLAAEKWAKENGITLSLVVSPLNDGVSRLYERMGYVPLEIQYVKRL